VIAVDVNFIAFNHIDDIDLHAISPTHLTQLATTQLAA
jgi:hypothetical protein